MRWQLSRLFIVLVLLGLIAVGASQRSYQAQSHPNTLKLWFFDIGQGDAVLIDTPDNHQILIDGGPTSSILSRLTRALPLTDKEIDLVILTHNHADHLNGLIEVLRHYKVNKVWISGATNTTAGYKTFVGLINDKQIPAEAVQTGSRVDFGDLHGIALTPFENTSGQQPQNQHDANVITFWQYGNQTLLETGDGETEQEDELARRNLLRPTTILKVGHHGSYTSTGEALLTAIQPKIAVISLGLNNKYGHPHQTTLDRLAKFGVPVLRSDQSQTILFSLSADSYTYQTSALP